MRTDGVMQAAIATDTTDVVTVAAAAVAAVAVVLLLQNSSWSLETSHLSTCSAGWTLCCHTTLTW